MKRFTSRALSALLIFTASSAAYGQADGQKVLEAWANLLVGGTWTTTRANGDRQDHTYRWTVPGKLLQLDGRGGPLPFVAMINVDPDTKQCAWTTFNDDGTVVKGTLTQPADGTWSYEEKGPGPQGEHRYKGQIIRVDSDTIKEEVSEFVVNGKPQPLAPATWKRTGQSTRKDFEEYCQALQGRWMGQITCVADWPGIGKKGDKVTTYSRSQISEDGNALVGTFFVGNASGTGITWFDAESKQIRELAITSGGTFWESAVSKEGGQWVSRLLSGSNPDGSATRGVSTLTISDNGDTHTWTGTGTLGGKPTDPQKDVFRRVSKK